MKTRIKRVLTRMVFMLMVATVFALALPRDARSGEYVEGTNQAPELTYLGSPVVNPDVTLELTVTATDPDLYDIVSLEVSNLPSNATFSQTSGNPSTGLLEWTPTMDDMGVWEVTFIANDDGSPPLSVSQVVTISVVPMNIPPLANAGSDQTLEQDSYAGASVTLDGSGSSDPDGDPLTYSWTWLGGSASGVNPTVTLSLGMTMITLVVNDGMLDSDPDTVDITVVDTTPPTVDAGPDQTVTEATPVTLNGSATDICDPSLDYEWSEGSTVLGNAATLTHIFPVGTHTVTLKAIDDSGNGGTDTVVVTVVAPVLPVEIDIKPGSYPNAINLVSQGVIPVAILSSSDFDATTVDPDTVELSGAGVAVRGKGDKYLAHEEDVNGDGLLDLVCKVETENLDPNAFQYGFADLTGQTYDDVFIVGEDEIIIVPPEE
jgi:hypothetical protein